MRCPICGEAPEHLRREINGLEALVRDLENENDRLRAQIRAAVSEALNSGDGSYRP